MAFLFKEALPRFYAEVKECLESLNERGLVSQLDDLRIVGRCGCGQYDCATFHVTGSRSPLSEAEQRDRGPDLRDSRMLDELEGWVVIDTDHLERVICFEILNRDDVRAVLETLSRDSPR